MTAVRRGWRARRNDENRASREAHAELAQAAADQAAEHLAKPEVQAAIALRKEQDTRRGTLTREALAGATHVHTVRGWHVVVRLNAKSVTVREYDGTSTIPYAQIDDHQTVKTTRPVAA